ncbi:hypothetical protein CVT24_008511 [Panaeolus cyanescens]|uniref:Uncharacterized protein n=1 Tax=Panaeolus cyanescens TaxID=181874 RepID=A0A409W4G9_9AGAR|nr:hypothetical protein CVT24_008511 [Panaeolus cyanescens]
MSVSAPSSSSDESDSASPQPALTTTQSKRQALAKIIKRAECPVANPGKLANDLINKFKWIARSIGLFLDMSRIIIAYVERTEDAATPEEKQYYDRIIKLHPELPRIFLYASRREEVATTLANIIEFHITEAKNSDTNTLRYLIGSLLPLDPRNPIQPALSGDSKVDRGFNHHATALALTPLKYLSKFERNEQAFMDKVNSGSINITHKLFPSILYPLDTLYSRDSISDGLFRGHVIIRAMRAIFHGPGSAVSGKQTGSKASQAEMHGMHRPNAEAVAYTALHVVFALSNIENWSRAHTSQFDFIKFYHRVLKMFTISDGDEDDWTTDTLNFLASKMPPLRPRQGKRKRFNQGDSSEDDENESDDELKLALKQRTMKRQRDNDEEVEQGDGREGNRQGDEEGEDGDQMGVEGRRPQPFENDEEELDVTPPPRSSSFAPESPLLRRRLRRYSSSTLMPPPPLPQPQSQLSDIANSLELAARALARARERSPTQEPVATESGRRSTLRSRAQTSRSDVPTDSSTNTGNATEKMKSRDKGKAKAREKTKSSGGRKNKAA